MLSLEKTRSTEAIHITGAQINGEDTYIGEFECDNTRYLYRVSDSIKIGALTTLTESNFRDRLLTAHKVTNIIKITDTGCEVVEDTSEKIKLMIIMCRWF